MSPDKALHRAIADAEAILPGTPAPEGQLDPRWQAIIAVGEFVKSHPNAVWDFTYRWGKHSQADLRSAIATCLLEHLLEYHFELIFPRVRRATLESVRFADTFMTCWSFGGMSQSENAARIQSLKLRICRSRKSAHS